jgi:glycosyltransferase involved in cell wall biosynthesis
MLSWLKRQLVEGEDWLRYHPLVRNCLSTGQLLRDQLSKPRDNQALARSIQSLAAAARLTTDPQTVQDSMARIFRRIRLLDGAALDWTEFVPGVTNPRMATSAILKPYLGPREKGVLFISFEREWVKLLHHCDPHALAERYHVVVSPSSNPHNLVNYVFPTAFPAPVFTLISNEAERAILPRISSNFVVVPLFASSWVDPDAFGPLPRDRRDIDILMVANWGKYKRHHALFKAVAAMPASVRVVLIGQDQDARTIDSIRAQARWYGVAERIVFQSNASWEQVAEALCRARVSVVLSRREGSCVVVAESLFADTPVALLRDAEIGSRAFLNSATGCFLHHHDLGRQLVEFLDRSDRYAPRRWAIDNISCRRSTRLLNDLLRQHTTAAGQEWTQDLATLCWRPDPVLLEAADRQRLQREYEEMQARFGLAFGRESRTGTE